jgi:hypothetical protein
MTRYKHEYVKMYLQEWNTAYSDVKVGSPVEITMNSPYASKKVVGYIHKVRPDISPEKHFVEVEILGASTVMKQATQKIWTQVTADQVVTEIAKKYNFSYSATPHPRVFDHLSQAGETDWEFLVKLAYRCGYTLRAEGTSLYFDQMTADFNDLKANAPYFIMRQSNHPSGFNLFSFVPEISEATEHDGAMKAATAVSGVDLNTASSLVKTNQTRPTTSRVTSQTEFFDRFHTSAVIPNASVATYEALAADERARYPYRGEAVVLGDARLRPDMPIYLDGIGQDYSGYWTILEARHIFKETMYVTELILGTDSLGQSSNGALAPNSIPVRTVLSNKQRTTVQPVSKLATNTKPVNGAVTNSGFSKTKNRLQTIVARSTQQSSSKWISTSGNLRNQPTKTNASPAAVAKLRSIGAR